MKGTQLVVERLWVMTSEYNFEANKACDIDCYLEESTYGRVMRKKYRIVQEFEGMGFVCLSVIEAKSGGEEAAHRHKESD